MVSNFKINQKDHQNNNNKCCLFICITTPKHDFHDYKNMTKQSNRTCHVYHFDISDNKKWHKQHVWFDSNCIFVVMKVRFSHNDMCHLTLSLPSLTISLLHPTHLHGHEKAI
jgi:hypothetical protein